MADSNSKKIPPPRQEDVCLWPLRPQDHWGVYCSTITRLDDTRQRARYAFS